MAPLLFFLIGVPAAFLLDRAIAVLSLPEAAGPDDDEIRPEGLVVKDLPWQVGPWPKRVRRGIVLLAPALMAIAGWRFGAVQAAFVSALVLAFLACVATDLIRYRVPNVITYPATLLALLAALVLPHGDALSGLAAAGIGGFVFLVMAVLTRGGLGLGDVKLAMLIGAALGLQSAYQALVLGILAGGLVIVALFLTGVVSRRQAVPYAPFLAVAAIATVLVRGAAFAPL